MSKQTVIQLVDGNEISILWKTVPDAKAQVIFAHGAGANMNHEFMAPLDDDDDGSGPGPGGGPGGRRQPPPPPTNQVNQRSETQAPASCGPSPFNQVQI